MSGSRGNRVGGKNIQGMRAVDRHHGDMHEGAQAVANTGLLVAAIRAGANIVAQGGEAAAGSVVLAAGLRLTPLALAVAVAGRLAAQAIRDDGAITMADIGNGKLFLGGYITATEVQYVAPTLGVGANDTYRIGGNGGNFAFVGGILNDDLQIFLCSLLSAFYLANSSDFVVELNVARHALIFG